MLQHAPQAQLLQFVLCRDGNKREDRLARWRKPQKIAGQTRVHSTPKTMHSRTSRETYVLCGPFIVLFFFLYCGAVCHRLGQGRLESAISCSEESIACGVQAARSSTCTAEHASGKTATARGSNIGQVNLPFAFCPSTHGSVRFALSQVSVWSSTLCHTTGLLPVVGRRAGVHRTARSIMLQHSEIVRYVIRSSPSARESVFVSLPKHYHPLICPFSNFPPSPFHAAGGTVCKRCVQKSLLQSWHCATRAVALVGLRICSLKITSQNLAGYF